MDLVSGVDCRATLGSVTRNDVFFTVLTQFSCVAGLALLMTELNSSSDKAFRLVHLPRNKVLRRRIPYGEKVVGVR